MAAALKGAEGESGMASLRCVVRAPGGGVSGVPRGRGGAGRLQCPGGPLHESPPADGSDGEVWEMWRLPMRTLVLAAAACLSVCSSARAGDPVTFESLLREMVDRDAIARFPEPAYTCKQFSSY